MPKPSANVLSTDREVQAAKAHGTRAEFRIKGARNLVLRITPAGAKAWTFLYASPATGRRRKLALGTYPGKSLATAKDEALRHSIAVHDGMDPLLIRSAEEAAETFASLARRYMVEHERKHSRAGQPSRSTREAQRLLDADILPALGGHKAAAVQRQHVMSIVDAVTDRGSYVVADRVLGLVRAIFNWAIGKGRLEANPTLGLKKRNTSRPRERVLTPEEIHILWSALEVAQTTSAEICDALKLQLLLGLRIGEALCAAQSEIDLDRRVWTIPAVRTKSKREHRLPLPSVAAQILRSALNRAGGSRWLFPSPQLDGPMLSHSATVAMQRLSVRLGLTNVRTHDLRRTLATGLGDLGVAEEVIDRVLNHAPRSVAGRHYNHAKHFEPMRRALEAWEEHVQGLVTYAACNHPTKRLGALNEAA